MEMEDEDLSEEEDIRLDAHGLRVPEQCIAQLMETDDEDDTVQICLACRARYDRGVTQIPPERFANASIDVLMEHCMTQHPAAWESLRQAVR